MIHMTQPRPLLLQVTFLRWTLLSQAVSVPCRTLVRPPPSLRCATFLRPLWSKLRITTLAMIAKVFGPSTSTVGHKIHIRRGIAISLLADVPILTGNTKDENGATLSGVSFATHREYVTLNFGNLSSKVYALYPASDNSSATTAYKTLIRDNTRATTYL